MYLILNRTHPLENPYLKKHKLQNCWNRKVTVAIDSANWDQINIKYWIYNVLNHPPTNHILKKKNDTITQLILSFVCLSYWCTRLLACICFQCIHVLTKPCSVSCILCMCHNQQSTIIPPFCVVSISPIERSRSNLSHRLVIISLDPRRDYGNYTCVAYNRLGSSNTTIQVSGKLLCFIRYSPTFHWSHAQVPMNFNPNPNTNTYAYLSA